MSFDRAMWSGRSPNLRLPFASTLQRSLPNRFTDRLVGGDGVEPFGLRFAVGSQEVNQTQGLTLRSQLRCPRPSVPHLLRLIPICRCQRSLLFVRFRFYLLNQLLEFRKIAQGSEIIVSFELIEIVPTSSDGSLNRCDGAAQIFLPFGLLFIG